MCQKDPGEIVSGADLDQTVLSLRSNVVLCATTDLNGMRKIICLRKSDYSVEIISVCNVIETLVEHDIHSLTFSYTNEVVNMLS